MAGPPPPVSVDAYALLEDTVFCIRLYLGADGTRM